MHRAPLWLSVLLGTVGCSHHDPRTTEPLLGRQPLVIGHRGAAALAPENTLAGFRMARDLGVAFELDVTMSSDGRVVVMHDDTLERTTGRAGFVDETPWAEMAELDAGGWFSPEFRNERIPTLDQVFEEIKGAVPMDIEIKSPRNGGSVSGLAGRVVDCIERHGMTERVFVTSFNPLILSAIRKRAPDIPRGQLVGTFAESELGGLSKLVLQRLSLNKQADVDIIVGEAAFLTGDRIRRYQELGYRVMAWTVNEEPEMRRLLELGVLGIITDDPRMALQVVRTAPGGTSPD